MSRRIDLNADLGEGCGDDLAMLAVVTSANVACGGHAGGPATMALVCRAAAQSGVSVGAHISYVDRRGFGRTASDVDATRLLGQLARQLDALDAAARQAGIDVGYIKAHGALYHATQAEHPHTDVVLQLAVERRLAVVGMPGTALLTRARRAGLTTVTEGFADRAYAAAGTLLSRHEAGAVLSDADLVAARAVSMAVEHTVAACDGSPVAVHVDTLCVHGDTPGAVRLAVAVRHALQSAGVELIPFGRG